MRNGIEISNKLDKNWLKKLNSRIYKNISIKN